VALPGERQDGSHEFVYLPLKGAGDAGDAARLRQALQDRFGLQLRDPPDG
jgi:hypothetical protein